MAIGPGYEDPRYNRRGRGRDEDDDGDEKKPPRKPRRRRRGAGPMWDSENSSTRGLSRADGGGLMTGPAPAPPGGRGPTAPPPGSDEIRAMPLPRRLEPGLRNRVMLPEPGFFPNPGPPMEVPGSYAGGPPSGPIFAGPMPVPPMLDAEPMPAPGPRGGPVLGGGRVPLPPSGRGGPMGLPPAFVQWMMQQGIGR